MTTRTLRSVLRPIDDPNHPDLLVLSVYRELGVVPKADRTDNFNKTPEDVSRYLRVLPGDLVVNKMKAWSGSVGVAPIEGIVSGDYLVCRPTKDILPGFLHHAMRSGWMVGEMRLRSKGIRPNQERLYWDDLAAIPIDLPDIEQQRRIADFLDDQVARIHNIVAAREKQVVLHWENLRKSLDFMWLQLAEKHGVARLSFWLARLEQGWSPEAEAREADVDKWAVMRAGCVNGGRFDELDHKALPAELVPRPEYEIRSGDLLMSRASGSRDLIGSVALVHNGVRKRLLLPDKLYRLTLTRGLSRRFVFEMLRTPESRRSIVDGISGAEGMANNIPSGVVRSIPIPAVIGEEGQAKIADRFASIWTSTDEITAGLRRSITLLSELKRSLITAAVTGEFDVAAADGSRVAV